jgi:NAD(P)-dependent dehydrogenase (short-subunit alcohol dehydrogenase family)
MPPRILVAGATGQIGREVVAQLTAADLPVRALSRNPRTARFPAAVEVVRGDLTAPETLDDALHAIGAVFLVWVAPLSPAARANRAHRSRAEMHRVSFGSELEAIVYESRVWSAWSSRARSWPVSRSGWAEGRGMTIVATLIPRCPKCV